MKIVDISTEETVEEKPVEETVVVEPEPIIEQPKEEEEPKTETAENKIQQLYKRLDIDPVNIIEGKRTRK